LKPFSFRSILIVSAIVSASLLAGGAGALLGVCGPFTDVAADAFCPFVLEIFTLGITTGTSPTTYDPAGNVSRLQMAAFLSRSVDRVLQRGSRRAALRQFWTPQNGIILGVTTLAGSPQFVESDGVDLWVAQSGNEVSRVRGGDGKLLETWTGALSANGIAVAMGKIFIAGHANPGSLYRIDPSQPAGAVTTVSSTLGKNPFAVAFDGAKLWTANNGTGASDGGVSIVTPGAALPWSNVNVIVGFDTLTGILYDGTNIWVADYGNVKLLKLDSGGAVLQSVTVGLHPYGPTFDGTNIWVPNFSSNSVSVVRASSGAVLATLTANGLNKPTTAAFDGQRILVTNAQGTDSVSLWKAADLTALGTFPTGTGTDPIWAASDGVSFWLALSGSDQLARF